MNHEIRFANVVWHILKRDAPVQLYGRLVVCSFEQFFKDSFFFYYSSYSKPTYVNLGVIFFLFFFQIDPLIKIFIVYIIIIIIISMRSRERVYNRTRTRK